MKADLRRCAARCRGSGWPRPPLLPAPELGQPRRGPWGSVHPQAALGRLQVEAAGGRGKMSAAGDVGREGSRGAAPRLTWGRRGAAGRCRRLNEAVPVPRGRAGGRAGPGGGDRLRPPRAAAMRGTAGLLALGAAAGLLAGGGGRWLGRLLRLLLLPPLRAVRARRALPVSMGRAAVTQRGRRCALASRGARCGEPCPAL